jgi:hypothetical protein
VLRASKRGSRAGEGMPQDREAESMHQARKQGDDPVIKANRGGAGARAQTNVGKKGGKRAREGRWREEKRRDAIGLRSKKQKQRPGRAEIEVAGLCRGL